METNVNSTDILYPNDVLYPGKEAHSSGVSWGAVIGGAFAAAAFYLILLALGDVYKRQTE